MAKTITIQLLDPFGNYRTQVDCGSGEAGECDSNNQFPDVGADGDWAGETYFPNTQNGPQSTNATPTAGRSNKAVANKVKPETLVFVALIVAVVVLGRR